MSKSACFTNSSFLLVSSCLVSVKELITGIAGAFFMGPASRVAFLPVQLPCPLLTRSRAKVPGAFSRPIMVIRFPASGPSARSAPSHIKFRVAVRPSAPEINASQGEGPPNTSPRRAAPKLGSPPPRLRAVTHEP